MNKSSETDNSEDNSSGAANGGNPKNKESKQNKNYQNINTKSNPNKNLSVKRTYCGQDGHFAIKFFKTRKGRATKVSQKIRLVVKNVNIMT